MTGSEDGILFQVALNGPIQSLSLASVSSQHFRRSAGESGNLQVETSHGTCFIPVPPHASEADYILTIFLMSGEPESYVAGTIGNPETTKASLQTLIERCSDLTILSVKIAENNMESLRMALSRMPSDGYSKMMNDANVFNIASQCEDRCAYGLCNLREPCGACCNCLGKCILMKDLRR